MTRLRLLREAKEELRAAAEFYESEQRGLGRALLHEVRRTLSFIAERPKASRAERGEVRVRTIARFLVVHSFAAMNSLHVEGASMSINGIELTGKSVTPFARQKSKGSAAFALQLMPVVMRYEDGTA